MLGKVYSGSIVAGIVTGAILHKMYVSKNPQSSSVATNSTSTGLSKDDLNTIRFITGARKTLFGAVVGGISAGTTGVGIAALLGRVLIKGDPSVDFLARSFTILAAGFIGTSYGAVTGGTYSFLNYMRG